MHRRNRSASWQRAYAPREALDPGEGEAVLGQALHDHSLPRDYPPPSLPTSRVVDFSRRLAVYVWNFHQVPAPIQTFSTAPGAAVFSRRLASRVVDFSRVQAAYPCEIFTQPRRLSKHFPPRLELLTFPETGGPPA